MRKFNFGRNCIIGDKRMSLRHRQYLKDLLPSKVTTIQVTVES